MCTTCGCSKGARTIYTDPKTGERVVEPNTDDGNSDPREKPVASKAAGGYQPLSAGAQGNRVAAYLHARAHRHGHAAHAHEHEHEHQHTSSPEPVLVPGAELAAAHGTTIALEQDILTKNQELAERNRAWLTEHRIAALNLVSAPGAGKTTLLERTIRDLRDTLPIHVIEGDQATLNDEIGRAHV